jgi:plasmid stability protein
MPDVATLYVRNVPADVYEGLRERARRNGRSLNGEALEILARASRRTDATWISDRLAEIARRINLPPDAPKPEDLIREDRDSR